MTEHNETQTVVHREDPEPFTIIVGIVAIIGGTASTVGYWRTHHRPLPHRTRNKLLSRLDEIAAEVRYLRADITELDGIFQNAEFSHGRTLRLGNGARLTWDAFRRYENLADKVYGHLKKINKLTLQAQGFAFELPFIDQREQTNITGKIVGRIENLVRSRDYSVEEAWRELHALVEQLEEMLRQLNEYLTSE